MGFNFVRFVYVRFYSEYSQFDICLGFMSVVVSTAVNVKQFAHLLAQIILNLLTELILESVIISHIIIFLITVLFSVHITFSDSSN